MSAATDSALGGAARTVWIAAALAATALAVAAAPPGAFTALFKWSPVILKGFAFNLFVSALAMLSGTVAGAFLGLTQLSRWRALRLAGEWIVQFFRNAPWLVLLFYSIFLIPFEFRVFGLTLQFPAWLKAVIGLGLPVMANVAEIVRGAVQSIPTAQWESAASLGLNRDFFVLHELWAGMLLAMSFGLHRVKSEASAGKWGWSLAAAALALAIRELSLPYVLLMAAMAFWRGDRREGLAWAGLAALFLSALAWHLHIIAAQTLPSDPVSATWWEMRGLSGWLSNVALSSNVRSLPHWLAGPLVILAIFGWASWRSAVGAFATLLYLGYGLAFMIAGRGDNYYWGFMVAPAMFIGLAFVPTGLKSLSRAALSR